MKAVLLNSGIGKRLESLTADKPKCLVELIDGKTILGEQLAAITRVNITQAVITTGPFASHIHHYVQQHFPNLQVEYIHNPNYAQTNYIYSLYLAESALATDVLVMHGDLVFGKGVLERLLADPALNATLVNPSLPLPEKDFKAREVSGNITEIGVNVWGENCSFLAPCYKLTSAVMQHWMEEIKNFVSRGETSVYAENAFNVILPQVGLKPVRFDGLFCSEIDNLKDLEKVRSYLQDEFTR